jgi:hypothetical protein
VRRIFGIHSSKQKRGRWFLSSKWQWLKMQKDKDIKRRLFINMGVMAVTKDILVA